MRCIYFFSVAGRWKPLYKMSPLRAEFFQVEFSHLTELNFRHELCLNMQQEKNSGTFCGVWVKHAGARGHQLLYTSFLMITLGNQLGSSLRSDLKICNREIWIDFNWLCTTRGKHCFEWGRPDSCFALCQLLANNKNQYNVKPVGGAYKFGVHHF